eukprot:TRINITY_DN38812_c0_g2_i1.p1 TRINITY_DN38812_c0_g2~~TRINITY_DN38812_c0_g2_i1.p1  ORF type:complete len:779 (-),score=178.98 TRINITY_DN38812_c0_g2_i1:59-2395(-)
MGTGASRQTKYQVQTLDLPSEEVVAEYEEDIVRELRSIPLFKKLAIEQIKFLATSLEPDDYKAGQVVFHEGDVGQALFLVRRGEAVVSASSGSGKPSQDIARLRAGSVFGEKALLHDEPRNATITAGQSALSTFKLGREKFMQLGLKMPASTVKREAVGANSMPPLKAEEPSEKTVQDRVFLAEALRENQSLAKVVTLTDQQVSDMIDACWFKRVAAGEELTKEGDERADYFYVVKEGHFTAVHAGRPMGEFSAGGSFGEMALVCVMPPQATVKATEASIVWVFDRMNFKRIAVKNAEEKVAQNTDHLKGVEHLRTLDEYELRQLACALKEVFYSKDEHIIVQGAPANALHLLVEGTVSVLRDQEELLSVAATATGRATCFGEGVLVIDDVHTETVTVTSGLARILMLDRSAVDTVLGPLEDTADSYDSASRLGSRRASNPRPHQASKTTPSRRGKILRSELKRIGLLGCGAFGLVELVEHPPTSQTFAMKSLSKGYLLMNGMHHSVMNERNILMQTDSPFIIKMYEAYESEQFVHLLLEVALGGELLAVYGKHPFHGSEEHARFYVAGIACALEHLHSLKIIYRDLKPENVLLDSQGYVKLTDMGLAKLEVGQTYTTCGTPEFLAPEVVQGIGHTRSADWWSLGVLTFELIMARTPWESNSVMDIYAQINKGLKHSDLPNRMRKPLKEFICGLMKVNPNERLPVKSGGTRALEDARWYKNAGFSWAPLRELKLEAPFKPSVTDPRDTSNFSTHKQELPEYVAYVDDGAGLFRSFATV